MSENEPRHDGLRILSCWAYRPPVHGAHTHRVKDERYWCPGYPSDPRHRRVDVSSPSGPRVCPECHNNDPDACVRCITEAQS